MANKTLSDKISYVMPNHVANRTGNPIILVSEVKEFIKQLKEEIKVKCGPSHLLEHIDKLAGDALVSGDEQ